MQNIDAYLEQNRERYEQELFDLLRIPSVSTDSAFAADVRRAGEFVRDQLAQSGFVTEMIETEKHPLVIGEWLEARDVPTLLVYGHFDVQPPDPLDLWTSGPFEPTVRDGNVYARGATDDKGQMYAHIKAVEAWLKTKNRLPINVKFLIEGEEEDGSESIEKYLRSNAGRFACDYVVISDCCQYGPDQPAITYGLKGISYFEVNAKGPGRDLHSGTFGGSVKNPANAICELMAALTDADGRIQLPGFYDDVVDVSNDERALMNDLGFNESAYCEEVGVREVFGETGYTTTERRWIRPTCDVNGIFGGYQGEGAKTVLPAKAGAKVSFRLVPNQDPRNVEAGFRRFLADRCPPGIELDVKAFHHGEPIVVPIDSPGVKAAASAIEAGFGKKPVFIREGGSIPIVSTFKECLGVDSLLIGFGLPDDNTHSPNEKFSLRDYHRGIKTSAYLMKELAEVVA